MIKQQFRCIQGDTAGCAYDTDQQLSDVWSFPADATDTEGLGSGLTWAWDATACDRLLPSFKEASVFPFISCHSLKAAVHRSFNQW